MRHYDETHLGFMNARAGSTPRNGALPPMPRQGEFLFRLVLDARLWQAVLLGWKAAIAQAEPGDPDAQADEQAALAVSYADDAREAWVLAGHLTPLGVHPVDGLIAQRLDIITARALTYRAGKGSICPELGDIAESFLQRCALAQAVREEAGGQPLPDLPAAPRLPLDCEGEPLLVRFMAESFMPAWPHLDHFDALLQGTRRSSRREDR